MEFGAENEFHFKISYDKAGCMSKILYDYSYYVYECEVKGTLTYSHDADGNLSAINADFSGERMENQKVHMSYSLKLLSD